MLAPNIARTVSICSLVEASRPERPSRARDRERTTGGAGRARWAGPRPAGIGPAGAGAPPAAAQAERRGERPRGTAEQASALLVRGRRAGRGRAAAPGRAMRATRMPRATMSARPPGVSPGRPSPGRRFAPPTRARTRRCCSCSR